MTFRFLPILILLFAWNLAAQTGNGSYVAFHAASLSTSTDKVTVQGVAGGKSTRFTTATIYCSVACGFTFQQNGAAATTTTLATTPFNLAPPSTATAWSASNVGTGTTLPTFNIPTGGGTMTFDISMFTLAPSPTSNLSIGIASMTGNTQIAINWTEQ
jgi:hypothetical protein